MASAKTYKIKEIYRTIQGEGAQTGRVAVFVRFSGCNLWSGREQDRHKAICQFCDTDFWGTDGENGGTYTAKALGRQITRLWPSNTPSRPFAVCTGGEPLLQLDAPLVNHMRELGIEIAIETNGTLPVPEDIDWVCMSPKANTGIVVRQGDEIKIVFPQEGIDPQDFEQWNFKHYFIQPMDGPEVTSNTAQAIHYCAQHPRWKLSVQTHKLLGMP